MISFHVHHILIKELSNMLPFLLKLMKFQSQNFEWVGQEGFLLN